MNPQSSNKVPATRIAYAVSVALTGNYAPAVLAQSQSVDLEAVIVTARKREETLLDIPQEIQAISQQQIERANLDSVKEISRFVPSLSYTATVPGRGTIYFRGVADDSSSFIADASAAIYLDEQPLTQSSLQPEIRLVDIERIEALPGPQGTLYGASSQAGTLRYITNKPDPAASRPTSRSMVHGGRRRRGLRSLRRREPSARRHRRAPPRRLLGARRRLHRQRASARAWTVISTTPSSSRTTSTHSELPRRPRGAALDAERELDGGRQRCLPADGRQQLRGRGHPRGQRASRAGRPRARSREVPGREPRATSGRRSR